MSRYAMVQFVMMAMMLTSLTIVNYYQLKVAGIAAIQRCTSH